MEKTSGSKQGLILLGGSAGALDVLFALLPQLKKGFAHPVVIILHRRGNDDGGLAHLLASKTGLQVREVEDKDTLRAGTIFLAPADYHLLFESDGTLSLDYSEKVAYSRPSIDVSFQSAALAHRTAVTGVLLSGANADGVEGLASIRQWGGTTVAQQPGSANMPYMPQQAINQGLADLVLDVDGIIQHLNGL